MGSPWLSVKRREYSIRSVGMMTRYSKVLE